jgi:DNA polymerase
VTTSTLHIDFETRSPVDLKKSGVYVYAENPHTDVTCAGYAFGDGPIEMWRRGEPCPPKIVEHVKSGGEIAAWNAAFERIVWWGALTRKGWPRPKLEQFRCVMVEALAMSLPGSLEMGAAALGITEQKDIVGGRLAIQMSKPRAVNPDGSYVWWEDPARLEKLYAYCRQDVVVERMADKRLMRLAPKEREIWLLDQRINDRGVKIDVALCLQASKIVAAATEKLDRQMSAVTGGVVGACSQVAQLMIWLRSRGVDTNSVDKEHLGELLGLDLPEDVERALLLRQEAAKASTAKIAALLNSVNRDGRARGLLQFHGASTGRWAGRRFQPQNLPRPEMADPEVAIPLLMTGDLRVVEMFYDRPLSVVSDCLRSMVRAG